MREKLEKIIDAYKELEAKLGDPSVIANQAEYNKLAKSYSDQGPLVKSRVNIFSVLMISWRQKRCSLILT